MDFRETQLLEQKWWNRLVVTLTQLDRNNQRRMADMAFRYHLALLSNGNLKPESFKEAQKAAVECYHEQIALMAPWFKQERERQRTATVTSARDIYKRVYGVDPSDPRVHKEIEESYKRFVAEEVAEATKRRESDNKLQERLSRRYRQGR